MAPIASFFTYSADDELSQFEEWAKSTNADLKPLQALCSKTLSCFSDSAVVNRVKAFVDTLKHIETAKRVNSLTAKRIYLQRETQNGPPVFSWAMPKAFFSDAAIQAFLRGPQQGPIVFRVGRGINHARSLARASRYGTAESRGYSAFIVATSSTGSNASVQVTKTCGLFECERLAYEEAVAELGQVKAELASLLGSSSSCPTSAGSHLISAAGNQPLGNTSQNQNNTSSSRKK